MISKQNLRDIAVARLNDAEVLHDNGRYDGAVYMCGYAVELALKSRICKTLRWKEFPATSGEFRKYQSFKVHDLEVLLSLTGIEENIKTKYQVQWNVVASWTPELRYRSVGTASQSNAIEMIDSATTLLGALR